MLDYVAIVLIVLFAILTITGSVQLIQILFSNNSKIALRNFIVLCLTTSGLLRVFFWCKVASTSIVANQFIMIIFFLPVWLDFAGLSGLALFYASALSRFANGPFRRVPQIIFVVANSIFLGFDILIGVTIYERRISYQVKAVIWHFYFGYSMFLDFLLALLLALLGFQFLQLTNVRTVLPTSIHVFAAVNRTVILCYTLRGIFTAMLAVEKLPNDVLPSTLYFNGDHPVTPWTVLIYFVVTEFIPNMCVIWALWRVSPSKTSYHSSAVESLQDMEKAGYLYSTDPSHALLGDSESMSMEGSERDSFEHSIYTHTPQVLPPRPPFLHSHPNSYVRGNRASSGSVGHEYEYEYEAQAQAADRDRDHDNVINTSGHTLYLKHNPQDSHSGVKLGTAPVPAVASSSDYALGVGSESGSLTFTAASPSDSALGRDTDSPFSGTETLQQRLLRNKQRQISKGDSNGSTNNKTSADSLMPMPSSSDQFIAPASSTLAHTSADSAGCLQSGQWSPEEQSPGTVWRLINDTLLPPPPGPSGAMAGIRGKLPKSSSSNSLSGLDSFGAKRQSFGGPGSEGIVKEKYSNTISPREILLMTNARDSRPPTHSNHKH